jgi:predicted nucleic acid-binding protein
MTDRQVLLDTSIWIDYFRGKDRKISMEVDSLLDSDRVVTLELIEVELLRGALTEKEIKFLEDHFSHLSQLTVSPKFWHKVGRFSYQMARKGYLPHLVDAFIALAAIENKMALFSKDRDFREIAQRSDLQLYEV